MNPISSREPWNLPEVQATAESHFWNRRQFIRSLGTTTGSLLLSGCPLRDDTAKTAG